MALIDSESFQLLTSQTLTGDALSAASAWCSAISTAVANRIHPFVAEPKTATSFVMDAPFGNVLQLLRPVRAITSIYLNCSANGAPALFTADTLLDNTNNGEYVLDIDDPETGWSKKGHVLRANGQYWGIQAFRYPATLSSTLRGAPRAISITYDYGCTSVPEDILGACVLAVQLAMQRRKTGAPTASESWNGYSTSAVSQYLATAIVNSPDVSAMLANYGPGMRFA